MYFRFYEIYEIKISFPSSTTERKVEEILQRFWGFLSTVFMEIINSYFDQRKAFTEADIVP